MSQNESARHSPFEQLVTLVENSRRLMVLTGAGVSTESGIPDYRDRHGNWKQKKPVMFGDFVADAKVRQRYWARSLIGWRRIARAKPNVAHMALADLESQGHVHQLLTQNVDGLHQQAGSRRVIDLHGRLDTVECLACSTPIARDDFQNELETRNPDWTELIAETAPDGDVKLDGVDFDTFNVPKCNKCAGNLKPSVVFFGETIPRERLGTALKRLDEADALLVAGSSLMVFSGYRFAREAHRRGIPVGVVNIGHTRADNEITFKVEGRCGDVLPKLTDRL